MENLIERAILYSKKKSELKLDHFSFEEDYRFNKSNHLSDTVTSLAEMERVLIYNTLKKPITIEQKRQIF